MPTEVEWGWFAANVLKAARDHAMVPATGQARCASRTLGLPGAPDSWLSKLD